MRRTRIQRVAVVLLILTNACACVNSVPTSLQGVKSVGVISAIADEFTVTPAGLTRIDSADRRVSIGSWGLDDLVVSQVGAVLSPHFQIQHVTYGQTAFARPKRTSVLPVIDQLRDAPVKALVRTEVSPQGLDAYVVVTKASSRYGSRGHIVSGLGIIDGSAVLEHYAEVYALYTIWVIDGHSFKVIDKKSASPLDNSDIIRLTGPSHGVDPGVLLVADLAANDQVRTAFIALVTLSLEATLRDLRLIGLNGVLEEPYTAP
jgi:hypothetical protein